MTTVDGSHDRGPELDFDEDFDELCKPAASDHAAHDPSWRHGSPNAKHISLDDVEPVDIRVRDVSVAILQRPGLGQRLRTKFSGADAPAESFKTLVQGVNANVGPGTLTAILGGSGSGKTTLLNTMAERMTNPRLCFGGQTTFNGWPGVKSVRHAYVMQQDVLMPTLTVRETLQYSADLRLPPSTTAETRRRIVEEVILELGLKECADTRIGSRRHRGCSGGEKRRVSIGVQLLANPSVLFLDEPTTGLDATSAFQLVRTLKMLARKGRTIITTIHQPRSEIWHLIDNVMVLTRGTPVYSGPASECLHWFALAGYELPPFVNPAEFVVDMAAVDDRRPELEQASRERVQHLMAAWAQESEARFRSFPSMGHGPVPVKAKALTGQHAGFLRQTSVLTSRTLRVSMRDTLGMTAALFEAVLMGVVIGYIFYQMPRDLAGIRSRQGALYDTLMVHGLVLTFLEVYRLTIDMPTFDREHSEGCSDVIPFLLARRAARFLTEDVPVPVIYSLITYWMMGFEAQLSKYLVYFGIVFLYQYICVTLAMTCVAAVRNFAGASMITNLVFAMQDLTSGFIIQSNSIAVYVQWLKHVGYFRYVFGALCANEFQGSFYACPTGGGESDPACRQYTGAFIMDSLGFPQDWIFRPMMAMAGFVLFFFTLSWFGLTFFPVEMTITSSQTTEADRSTGKEKMRPHSMHEVRSIDVGLESFTLTLDKRSPWGKKMPTKTVLRPINAVFQAGTLNVIMGPSGSGKTSLLDALALRLRNDWSTRYRRSGKLTYNGAEPSDSVVQSVCCYVVQDDDALLPSLTVRETLRFAAALRLPRWMSSDDKLKRAEDVLLKMGLRDCADNLVGNHMVKGISGGEKRRVSIAVQILTEPRILLLDEPTSGLDAFTANSIMDVLHGLAREGRTLVLTIHQARSDLFSRFGNVLLLARGGSPAYAGPAKDMVGYFLSCGFPCPRHSNPADFALDLITVDLQEEQREARTRERVEKLVLAWHVEVGLAKRNWPLEAQSRPKSWMLSPRLSNGKTQVATPAELGALVRKRASFVTAVPTLLHRAVLNIGRQPGLIYARTMQPAGMGVLLALFAGHLRSDYYSVQTRVGVIQWLGCLYFSGVIQNSAVYPTERNVFNNEADDGLYGVEAFLATYTLLEIPGDILGAMIFGLLGDLAIGLPANALMYFVMCFACAALVGCGESLGIMINTLVSESGGFAVTLTTLFFGIAQILGALVSINMPAVFVGVNYLNPVRYSTKLLASFSLRGIEFSCGPEQRLPSGKCAIANGEEVLNLFGLAERDLVNFAGLAGCVVAYRLAAWAGLRLARTRWDGTARICARQKEGQAAGIELVPVSRGGSSQGQHQEQ